MGHAMDWIATSHYIYTLRNKSEHVWTLQEIIIWLIRNISKHDRFWDSSFAGMTILAACTRIILLCVWWVKNSGADLISLTFRNLKKTAISPRQMRPKLKAQQNLGNSEKRFLIKNRILTLLGRHIDLQLQSIQRFLILLNQLVQNGSASDINVSKPIINHP